MWNFASLRVLPPFRSKTWSLNTFTQQSLTTQYKIATKVDYFITEESLCVDAAAWEWLNLCHSWDSPRAEFGLVAGGQALRRLDRASPWSTHSCVCFLSNPCSRVVPSRACPTSISISLIWKTGVLHKGVHFRLPCLWTQGSLSQEGTSAVLLFFFFFPSLENFIQIPIFAPDLLRQIYWLSFSVLRQ